MALKRTPIQVDAETHRLVMDEGASLGLKAWSMVRAMARGWSLLSPELKASAIGLADAYSPSIGNRRHGGKPATAKQPLTRRLPAERRKAG